MKAVVSTEDGDSVVIESSNGDATARIVAAVCAAVPCGAVYLAGNDSMTINAFVDNMVWSGRVPVFYNGLKVGHVLSDED